MLATRNERSVLENMQVYWIYYSVCASLLEIMLKRAIYPGNLHTLSSISSKLAHFLKYFVHFLLPASYKLYKFPFRYILNQYHVLNACFTLKNHVECIHFDYIPTYLPTGESLPCTYLSLYIDDLLYNYAHLKILKIARYFWGDFYKNIFLFSW